MGTKKKKPGKILETVYKTVSQHNKTPLSKEDMEKLQEIAEDYRRVKNHVYARYGGKGGLAKLYPGYTAQNEMTESGLRAKLGMPAVYFYLAVFDALGDIKSQWTRTKSKILKLVGQNEGFTAEEKHYLRFLLKVTNAFEAVLNEKPIQGLPKDMQQKHDALAEQVNAGKLRRYVCRQVRKYHVAKLHAESAAGFSTAKQAYRYADHGIYISTKQSRKRVFVPLTDNNRYSKQLYVRLDLERNGVEIKVPIRMSVRNHPDYVNRVGLSMGVFVMLTTDAGHGYGERLGEYQTEYAEWARSQTISYHRSKGSNIGRKKYRAKKRRHVERLHSYINQELNRFLLTEKPQVVYLAKLPPPRASGKSSRINNSVTFWQRGYIRERLAQKCRQHSVELVEVLGKDISRECSDCGAMGQKQDGMFRCPSCGNELEEKTNTAKNALKRGTEGKILR